MTVNNYFNTGIEQARQSEQNLAESNIIELIQMAGFDIFYLPRSMFAEDKFFREVPNDKFEDFFVIEMYMTNVTDFINGDQLGNFNFEVEDTANFVVSRKRFTQETDIDRPEPGDLIYFPLTKHLLQIDYIDDEPGDISGLNQFYSLGRTYTYSLTCGTFKNSYEDFNTGLDIDDELDNETYIPKGYDSEIIEREAEDRVLDFSEDNPFGDTVDRSD